jgi:hypothetical protein
MLNIKAVPFIIGKMLEGHRIKYFGEDWIDSLVDWGFTPFLQYFSHIKAIVQHATYPCQHAT